MQPFLVLSSRIQLVAIAADVDAIHTVDEAG